jgi:hypothetical protein
MNLQRGGWLLWNGLALALTAGSASAADALRLVATGQDRRVDLRWDAPAGADGFVVRRATDVAGPFVRLHEGFYPERFFSDFLGTNGLTRFYRVEAWRGSTRVARSAPVRAETRAMSEEELLTSVQAATFRYFWDYAHPVSGLARERTGSGDTCTSGGTGFGLMAMCVAVERGFVSRREAAGRVTRILRFLEEKAIRYHGAWAHWIHGRTGATIPFSRYDDGGDLVETAYVAQALLTLRRFFTGDAPTEREIRERATRLWEGIEWDWYLQRPERRWLLWHWSPRYGWKMNHRIGGHFNECLITYLLAVASPTHPIPAACYRTGWTGDPPSHYVNGHTYYGHRLAVGMPYGGPLFFTHYSFLGFDPRQWRDDFCNYADNNRTIALIHRDYCAANPKGFRGYSARLWGLTASDTPGGYRAHSPTNDNGTIAPTAALASMPWTPEASRAALREFYVEHGARLWGHCGFKDAFNLSRDWVARGHLAIDQGPIIIMIENHRTGLCWRLFMANPEIPRALRRMGWRRETR